MPEPLFVHESEVHWDELDAMQMLHNSRYAAHVERAVLAFFRTSGRTWRPDVEENPDQFHVVRAMSIEFLNPVVGPGTMRVELSVERLGTTSCTYAFRCTSPDGRTIYARGERTIVKLDPKTRTPVPWSDFFRNHHATEPERAFA